MNILRSYLPGFMINHPDDCKPTFIEFRSWDELKKHEDIARKESIENFYQFSQKIEVDRTTLMVEYDKGHVWFVVGFLPKPIPELPTWYPQYTPERFAEQWEKQRAHELKPTPTNGAFILAAQKEMDAGMKQLIDDIGKW